MPFVFPSGEGALWGYRGASAAGWPGTPYDSGDHDGAQVFPPCCFAGSWWWRESLGRPGRQLTTQVPGGYPRGPGSGSCVRVLWSWSGVPGSRGPGPPAPGPGVPARCPWRPPSGPAPC